MVLDSRVYSARFKDEALAQVCPGPVSSAGETVDVSAACTALQAWDGTGTAASRGSHVWDEFWKRVASQIKSADLYAVPFDAADPVNTPRGIKPTAKAALQKAFRSEEHTSELQSQSNLVCRLLLEKKKKHNTNNIETS